MAFFLNLFLSIGILVLIGACDSHNPQPTNVIHNTVNRSIEPIAKAENESRQDKNQARNIDLVNDFGFSTVVTNKQFTSIEAPLFCLDPDYVLNNSDKSTIAESCTSISNRLASVSYSTCINAKLAPSQCHSVTGFPLLYRELKPLTSRKPLGRVLLIGGTHGDELTSVSIIFRWIEQLNKHHSGLFHWRIIPMLNPDGVLKKSAARTNQHGVDLNRNLPSPDWSMNALKYWHSKTRDDPRKYPGERAASEPENQWLIDEINTFKPDAIISVHAPYGVVDFDAPALNTAPKSLGKLRLNLLGTYPGSLGNYAGISKNIPTITLELPHSWIMPSHIESTRIWEDLVNWLKINNSDSPDS